MLSAARPHCDAVQIRATNASPDPVSMVRKRMTLVCSQYASVPKKRSSSRRLNNFRGAYAEPNSRGRKAVKAPRLQCGAHWTFFVNGWALAILLYCAGATISSDGTATAVFDQMKSSSGLLAATTLPLRLRREWRCRRAAEKGYELAPPHARPQALATHRSD
jgi:hypothetical protein